MQTTVFCKTVAKGVQAYYVKVNGKEYFLFMQSFRRSNKDFFGGGVKIGELTDFSRVHSHSVRKTLDKLPPYLRYAEKEYGVKIYGKKERSKNRTPYKRENYRWQDFEWEVA